MNGSNPHKQILPTNKTKSNSLYKGCRHSAGVESTFLKKTKTTDEDCCGSWEVDLILSQGDMGHCKVYVGESWSGIGEKEKKNYREKLEEKKRGGEAREINWFVHSQPHHYPRWGPYFFHQPLAQMHAGRAGNAGIAVVGCLYSPLDVYHSHPLAGGKT